MLRRRLHRRLGGLLAACALLVAGPALAASYQLEGTIPGTSQAHVVKYEIYGQKGSAYAVGFDAKLDGVSGVSFCGDLLHTVNVPATYVGTPIDLGTLDAGYTVAAKMVQRWSFDLGSLAGSLADAAAGLQLAVWETIYGTDFSVTSALSAGTQAAYDAVMGTDYSGLGVGDTVFLDVKSGSTSKQDHFFTPDAPSTPEPGAALLFGAGLVVVARGLRRERA